MDELTEFERRVLKAYALAGAIMNINARRKVRIGAREKAKEWVDEFRSVCFTIGGCKRSAKFAADVVIAILKERVPCGNTKFNDNEIKFYEEVKRQINKL